MEQNFSLNLNKLTNDRKSLDRLIYDENNNLKNTLLSFYYHCETHLIIHWRIDCNLKDKYISSLVYISNLNSDYQFLMFNDNINQHDSIFLDDGGEDSVISKIFDDTVKFIISLFYLKIKGIN